MIELDEIEIERNGIDRQIEGENEGEREQQYS